MVCGQAKTVVITMEDGSAETFDAVVFVTQANQVVAILDDASAEERVLQDCSLQRPIVDLATQANLHQLDVLHAQPERRVFFCGFYAAQGIPLLESAVASALHIAQTDNFKP